MNWYKKAELWYEFSDTITLYHGTTDQNLKSILQEGHIKPFDPNTAINEILNEYNFIKDNVPEWIWKYELDYRKNTSHIYFTTSKQTAKQYADKSYGEFKNTIISNLIEWQRQENNIIQKKEYKPIIITIDVPWNMVEGQHDIMELKSIYEGIIKNTNTLLEQNQSLEDFLLEINFEYVAKKPIPKEYIIKWEYV